MEAKPNEFSLETQEKIHSMCLKQSSDESLQDDYGLYIPPSGTHSRYAKSTFDLNGAVNDFIEGDKRVLLILGESGCGKSFFSQALIKRKSEAYHSEDRIPLYISLPSLRSAKTSLMVEALGHHGFTKEDIEVLRTTQKFLLVFDAYDELNSYDNLYMTNNMDEWNAKIIITCRIDYLTPESNYKCYFMPYKQQKPLESAIQELFVAPFVRGQIERYIFQYLKVKRADLRIEILIRPELSNEWLVPKTYESWIEKIPGLKELVCQPFLLRITIEVLPEVIVEFRSMPEKQDNYKMTSVKLYDHFVDQWFSRQKNKLNSIMISLGEFVPPTFQKDCIDFAKALAKKMQEKKIDVVYYEDQAMGFIDEEVLSKHAQKEMAQWAIFFSDEMVPQDKGSEKSRQKRVRIRKASLLKKLGDNQWAFMHASLRDYFMSLNIVGPQIKYQLSTEKLVQSQELSSPRNLLRRTSPRAAKHRVVGSFFLLNRLNHQEAGELLNSEGVNVIFESEEESQKVVLGQGSFGKLRIAQHLISHRFSGVKRIRGEKNIKGSTSEAEFQRELNGLPNVMPIWDSQIIKSKRSNEDVLLQFMPLAGFGNGEKLILLLSYIDNHELKRCFLIHILKSLLTGVKGLHSRRVCHLDLKPANFVIDCSGEIYIIDFGCSYREYGNKNDALISGGKGDYDYFSPDRFANKRKHPFQLLGPSDNHEIGESYDGDKADIWAVGISLLKLYVQDLKFISGSDKSAHWIIENLTPEYFMKCFNSVDGWSDAPENSLLGCIKTLLQIVPNARSSAAEALKNPLFLDPNNQLSPEDLQQLMIQLIRWKTDPPNQAEFSVQRV